MAADSTISPPNFCTSADCTRPPRKPFLVLVEVEDVHYQRAIGTFSQFSIKGKLRLGLEIKSWHTRCVDCFYSYPPKIETTWTGP